MWDKIRIVDVIDLAIRQFCLVALFWAPCGTLLCCRVLYAAVLAVALFSEAQRCAALFCTSPALSFTVNTVLYLVRHFSVLPYRLFVSCPDSTVVRLLY